MPSVTVVDAKTRPQHLDTEDESVKQLAFADVILLNKTISSRRRTRCARGPHQAHHAVAKNPPHEKLRREPRPRARRRRFNLSPRHELDPQFMEPEYPFEWAGAYALPRRPHELVIGHCDHDHDHSHEGHHHDARRTRSRAPSPRQPERLDVVIMPIATMPDDAAGDAAPSPRSDRAGARGSSF